MNGKGRRVEIEEEFSMKEWIVNKMVRVDLMEKVKYSKNMTMEEDKYISRGRIFQKM